MRAIDTTEDSPSTDLEASIHQHHKGLTVVAVRRRGRSPFCSLQLEGKDGAPVGHREPPSDAPPVIAREVWERCSIHSLQNGPGTYEVELRFAGGERGAAPKPIVVTIPVGADAVDLGNGPDPKVIVDQALVLTNFCVKTLGAFMEQLPAIAKGTTDNLTALQTIGTDLLTAMRENSAGSAQVELARIQARTDADRHALANKYLEPAVEVLKRTLGIAPPTAAKLRDVATTPAAKPTATTTTTTTTPTTTPTTSKLDDALTDALNTGRQLAASLTDGQMVELEQVYGIAWSSKARSLATGTEPGAVFNLLADMVDAGDEAANRGLALLTNEQTTLLLRIKALADTIAALKAGAQ